MARLFVGSTSLERQTRRGTTSASVIRGRTTSARAERKSAGGEIALGPLAKSAAGIGVAAFLWVVLEWSQRSWFGVGETRDDRLWDVPILVLAGLVLFAAARWASSVTLGVATAVLAIPVVPAALGGDVFWPSFLPGEPLVVASTQGSLIVVGVLAAAFVSKAVRSRPEH